MNSRHVFFVCASALSFAFSLMSAPASAGDLKHKVTKVFKEHDANEDGVITRAESGASWLNEKFEKIDANKDDKLTFDEVLSFKQAHHKQDDCKDPSKRT